MMSSNKEDKIRLEALLKTYSVNEIASLFTEIDKKLISLHNRSADDFMQLNNSFKDIYYKSNKVSENTNILYTVFNTDKKEGMLQIIENLYEKLKAQFEVYDYRLLVITDQLEKLTNQIRHFFFPIKNFSQNLMSLNYLMANLRVSLTYNKDVSKQLEKSYSETEKKIESVKLIGDEVSSSLNNLSKDIKRFQGRIKDFNNFSDIDLDNLLEGMKSSILTLVKKEDEIKNTIPEIKKSVEELSSSNAEIIKKLQYQDIIRQKMEHIQKTHKDLVEELVELNETNADNLNEKAKCFLRIRDISGLQAAQLIQANKEYQSAIEVITNSFISIGDNVRDITKNCERMYSYGNVNYNGMLDKISSYIDNSSHYIENYNKQTDNLDKDLNQIYTKYCATEDLIEKFKNETNNLGGLLSEFNLQFHSSLEKNTELGKTKIQLTNLSGEINENSIKLIELFNPMLVLKKNIEGFVHKTDKGLIAEIEFSEFKSNLNKLKVPAKEIGSVIITNKEESKNVVDSIKSCISKLKYYEYFEKIIQGIITELNTVNYKLKMNEDIEGLSKEENLEKLKEYYTMQTEHIIHDQVAKGEESDINFEINEDDDIEFF